MSNLQLNNETTLWGALSSDNELLSLDSKPAIVLASNQEEALSKLCDCGMPYSMSLYYEIRPVQVNYCNRQVKSVQTIQPLI